MPIKLLPDGTPEERARMAKSAALADKLDLFLQAQQATTGTVIEAIGMLFGGLKSDNAGAAQAYAVAISTAVNVCFQLKEKTR